MTTIDTNMSLVMIDPNEPLELYDGTIIKGRLEWFLYALCCLDYGNLPTPLSRIEEWANALITNELPNMEPQSRAEEFFKAILTGDTSNLPTPQSRSEVLLDKLARGENDFTNVEKIQSRYEFLLAYLIKNGGGIGNIDYVLYKFQKEDETLYNTKERPVKSAILKGQTLVNLVNDENKVYTLNVDGKYKLIHINLHTTLEANKKYYLSYRVVTNTILEGSFGLFATDGSNHCGLHSLTKINETGVVIQVGVVNKMADKIRVFAESNCVSGVFEVTDIVLMEYQDGMENWDIPYFEGIQSVKMPVLTTVGKNLFDGKLEVGHVGSNGTLIPNTNGKAYRSINFIELNDSETFVASYNELIYTLLLIGYDAPYNENGKSNGWNNNKISDKKYAKIEIRKKDGSNFTSDELQNIKIQIEQGSVATSYEPFKSNILTVNEDITLRSNGSVCDELDLLTGKLTQRIDEDGEILTQEVVKTVDLTITDQGGATIPKLNTFDKITHVNVSATDILPGEVEMEVATTIGEDLSGTLYSTMEDIEAKQEALKESNNAQTESINSTMMATTEIYESLL